MLSFLRGVLFINQNNTKKWYVEIEWLRGIAIIMVLLIHTFGFFTQIPEMNILLFVTSYIDVIASLAVPLFVFISSLLMTLQKSYLINYNKFIFNRLKFILVPYIIFSIIYIVFYSYWNNIQFPKLRLIVDYLYNGGSAFHLYFIPIIVGLYIFYHIFYYLFVWLSKKLTPIFPIVLSLIIQNIWINQQMIIERFFPNVFKNSFYGYLSTFTSFSQVFIYIILGIYFGINYEFFMAYIKKCKLKTNLIIALLLSLIVDWEWLAGIKEYGNFYAIPSVIMIPTRLVMLISHIFWFFSLLKIFEWLQNTKNRINILILEISRFSFSIFLIHIIYFEILLKIFTKYHLINNRPNFYIFFFLILLCSSYFSVRIISLIPFHRIVIGKIAKKVKY